MSDFTAKAELIFSWGHYIYKGWVVYDPPTQAQRVDLMQRPVESDQEHRIRILTDVVGAVLDCEFQIYDASNVKKLDKLSEEELEKLCKSAEKVNTFSNAQYINRYDFCDRFFAVFFEFYGRGMVVGKLSPAKS